MTLQVQELVSLMELIKLSPSANQFSRRDSKLEAQYLDDIIDLISHEGDPTFTNKHREKFLRRCIQLSELWMKVTKKEILNLQ